jgi:peptidoglycan-N-acetylglucosamine deacetylase
MYLVKAHCLLKKLYPEDLVWKRDATDTVYITFDDGPHPFATPFVLGQLKKYNAKATFFCIGKNVTTHPQIYQQTINDGHKVGNHTHTHANGWKVNTKKYLEDFATAQQLINSHLFRPPYGKIRRKQAQHIQNLGFEIVMWDVLCGDFDTKLSPEKCWENIALNIEPGSIIVFHDSSKAWDRMSYALPRTLAFCKAKNWKMETL